jgi:hypothetical protein
VQPKNRSPADWVSRQGQLLPSLAEKAGISLPTGTRLEAGAEDNPPSGTARTAAAVQAAFETGGVEFIAENGGGPGVRLAKRKKGVTERRARR